MDQLGTSAVFWFEENQTRLKTTGNSRTYPCFLSLYGMNVNFSTERRLF
jgi:hypothetical protein